MAELLKVGDSIPAFTAQDAQGEPISLDDLKGAPFVIYFYPKDNTPGCTLEACSFRDVMDHFNEIDFMVVGVSGDSPESHQKFIEKHELNFPLISDEGLKLATDCGAVKVKEDGKKGIVRSTFLCDEDGVVQWVESPVNVDGHVHRVVEAIEHVFG